MKAIRSLAEDVQQQVDLAGGIFAQRHETKNAPTPKRCWRM
jgi:hypothetical protein